MGNYQYCSECGNGLNPTPSDILDEHIECSCGKENQIVSGDDMKNDLLKEMFEDIRHLKEVVDDNTNL